MHVGVIPSISTIISNEILISKPKEKRRNEAIRVPRVQVIDAQGEFLGEMDTSKALEMAKEANLDLVEIAPNAEPPVTKIMDLGKVQYEREKESRKGKGKQKRQEIKGIRLSFKIGEHDLNVRIKSGRKFIDQGHKLKLEMRLRGREKGARDLAKQRMEEYVEKLERNAAFEGRISYQGNRLTAIVSGAKAPKEAK